MVKSVVQEIREITKYRELLKNLVVRDLKVRYRRSVLGFAWVMLNPLLMMLILSVVFSELFKISTKSYTVYLLSGIIMWNFFSQSTTVTVISFLANANIIKKIYLPKSIFPLSSILSAAINFIFSIVPLALILLFTHTPLSGHFYFIPIVLFFLIIFSFGLSLALSTLAVFFHDIIYIYEVVLLAWMYATPVFYPESIIPERFKLLIQLNPLYYFIKLFRGWLYMDLPLYSWDLMYVMLYSLLSLLIGCALHFQYRDRVIYYL